MRMVGTPRLDLEHTRIVEIRIQLSHEPHEPLPCARLVLVLIPNCGLVREHVRAWRRKAAFLHEMTSTGQWTNNPKDLGTLAGQVDVRTAPLTSPAPARNGEDYTGVGILQNDIPRTPFKCCRGHGRFLVS
jgi:hypothetical protein